jgi:hypothetical protein
MPKFVLFLCVPAIREDDDDLYNDGGAQEMFSLRDRRSQHHNNHNDVSGDLSKMNQLRWMGIGKREPAFTPFISVGQ